MNEEELFDWKYDIQEVTCGNQCGHWDSLNQCCWLSWRHKEEGDYCNYGLKELNGQIYTPKQLEELRKSSRSTTK